MSYKVLNQEFETFEDVVKWAWTTHKIEAADLAQTEADRQEACAQLTDILSDPGCKCWYSCEHCQPEDYYTGCMKCEPTVDELDQWIEDNNPPAGWVEQTNEEG